MFDFSAAHMSFLDLSSSDCSRAALLPVELLKSKNYIGAAEKSTILKCAHQNQAGRQIENEPSYTGAGFTSTFQHLSFSHFFAKWGKVDKSAATTSSTSSLTLPHFCSLCVHKVSKSVEECLTAAQICSRPPHFFAFEQPRVRKSGE